MFYVNTKMTEEIKANETPEEKYLKDRVKDQMNWYDKKSVRYKSMQPI